MIKDRMEKEVEMYCESRGIDINDGRVKAEHVEEIKEHITKMTEVRKKHTREMEKIENMKGANIVKTVLNGICKEIIFSPIETYVWAALKREGLTIIAETQYPIGKYKIDIAFPDLKLAIECDGAEYHYDERGLLEKDQRRDTFLARKGWLTLRFKGVEIRRDIQSVVDKIKNHIPKEILSELKGVSHGE